MSRKIYLDKNENNERESDYELIDTCEKVELNGICLDKEKAIKQITKNEYLDDLIIDFFLELAKVICVNNDGNIIYLDDEKYADIITVTDYLDDEEEMRVDTKKEQRIMINEKNKFKSKINYCILTSLFNTILSGCREILDDYMCIRRWLKKLNTPILLSDVIVIPMHCSSSSHWWLMIICYPWRLFESRNSRIRFRIRSSDEKNNNSNSIENSSKGWIICMDSLGNRNVSITEKKKQVLKILRFLNVEYYTNNMYSKYISSEDVYIKSPENILKIEENKLLSDWFVLHSPRNVPYQENSFDCGVYIIEYIHLLFHLGTEMFNNMTIKYESEFDYMNKNTIFNNKWINNRRNVYARTIDFISYNTNWTKDTCLKNRLVNIFDDNMEIYKAEDNREIKFSSSTRNSNYNRKRFSMYSFNRNYFFGNKDGRNNEKK
ncbi:ULP1 like protease with a chlamydin like cysteine protease domain [Cryptosporidium xiaoi]|uniref:ULP1 like protease with a chlamydin like cysteine protease domain n=1 Tax=Cryptosporidium xiaoi TaxID=659607 RepID=A0AAV9XXH0_9CRYT